MIAAVFLGRTILACWVLLGFVLLANIVAYRLAVRDKRAARSRRRRPRVPERTFHVLAAFGAGPGAFAAFLLHRHKTRKGRFLVPFLAASVLGAVLVGAWGGLLC